MATSQLSQTAVGEALLSIALLPERSQLTTSQTRTVVPGSAAADPGLRIELAGTLKHAKVVERRP